MGQQWWNSQSAAGRLALPLPTHIVKLCILI